MKFHAYIFDKDGLTKPVYVASYDCENEGDAIKKAEKNPGAKMLIGKQQTGRLNLRILSTKIEYGRE